MIPSLHYLIYYVFHLIPHALPLQYLIPPCKPMSPSSNIIVFGPEHRRAPPPHRSRRPAHHLLNSDGLRSYS